MAVVGGLRAAARKIVLRWAMRKTSGGLPDITTLKRVPEHLTYPLRRLRVDPVPQLAEQRAIDPIHQLGDILGIKIWLVSGHEEAKVVLADMTSYSNDIRHLLGKRDQSGADGVGGLGFTDPPDHTRLRGVLTPEFTMRRLRRLDEGIEAIVEKSLDEMESAAAAGDGTVDLVDLFGFEIPFRVICDLLGMPEDVRDEFHDLGIARFDVSEGGAGAFDAASETRSFLIETVRRQRDNPGDGMIGEIIRTKGDEFDDVELGGLADGVFLGGYETSAAMLSMGAYVLTQNPEAYRLLREGTPAEVNSVVDELLRYLCPVQIAFPRFARHSHDLFGHSIGKGDVVIVSLSGANRDPAVIPNPEQFDLRNAETMHFAFGHGMHRCVGAELARMELRAALTGLARRFPDLAMATSDLDELGFRNLSIVYGLDRLPVHLHGAPVTV
ncbi:cytochrome P450 [Nocardioides sp. Kera G14]|uniref:cytochrome P450 n=1 Tax=Nocardioides sp. Kera G14 TaxID=2884264 RepID=UPI001D0FC803|nr:cytochrome P450 [Nocardioides sp. Kera G14]UDY24289.1 cytochrome P450 [Nocardioides sp. Kera G14]